MFASYTLDDDVVEQMNVCVGSISSLGAWAASACSDLGENPEVDLMLILKKLRKHTRDMPLVSSALKQAFHECYAVHAQKERQ